MKMFIDDNVIIPDENVSRRIEKGNTRTRTRIERTKTGFIITTVHNIIPTKKRRSCTWNSVFSICRIVRRCQI